MKYYLLTSFLLFNSCLFAQRVPVVENKVFQVVEQMPEFPGGEDSMRAFIGKNIQYPKKEMEENTQGRVVVGFVVNEDGSLSDVTVKKNVSPGIDAEAVRVVKLLPKFKPGMQQGKPVKVAYVLPLSFKLQDAAPKEKSAASTGPSSGDAPPSADKTYQVVEQMPEFPGGDDAMRAFIGKNIQYPKKEMEDNIQGRVVVGFVVNEDGSLSDVTVKKNVSPGIDAEAVRVVKLLPKFKPGMQQGKLVKVAYVLPISFKLQDESPKAKGK